MNGRALLARFACLLVALTLTSILGSIAVPVTGNGSGTYVYDKGAELSPPVLTVSRAPDLIGASRPMPTRPASSSSSVVSLVFAAEDESSFVNLASDARTSHILDGHMPPGEPGNTLFPGDWSAAKIMNGVSEVATDPANTWVQQTGRLGADFTRAGDPVRFAVDGVYDGLKMRVIIEPGGEGIITGFPVP